MHGAHYIVKVDDDYCPDMEKIKKVIEDAMFPKYAYIAGVVWKKAVRITHVVPWMLGQSGDIADAAGQSWRLQDIRGATVVIMVFTMLFTSLLALIRLLDRARPDERPRVSN